MDKTNVGPWGSAPSLGPRRFARDCRVKGMSRLETQRGRPPPIFIRYIQAISHEARMPSNNAASTAVFEGDLELSSFSFGCHLLAPP